ncbi:MAG: phosphoribosylamine--glycine ligase [Thermoleophilaceae bacterium]|nr:phosphoribosylamine--glycine ligase [Thermoleophilaceae bacterium]
MTRVLVVGSGGREHALVRGLLRSPGRPELVCAPGNAGIARDHVPCVPVGVDDVEGIVRVAVEERCDLAVIGPEVPLVRGVVDALAEAHVRAFGPTATAARIEGSKAYAKELMAAVGVPTAAHRKARDHAEGLEAVRAFGTPVVIKADSLAAGKGVMMCRTEQEALAALDSVFLERRFGATSAVVEEMLEGEELSLLALCDGVRAVPMAPARDYKRIFDDDEGPNTGGMGSFSPVPGIDREHAEVLARAVHQPILDELRARGTPYHGVLYAGLMMTASGPRVLEYNCRFGDPEAQAVLPRLRSDLLDVLERSVRPGGLEGVRLEWSSEWAVTVVLASRGYPESSSHGDAISGLRSLGALETEVLHAGTADVDGKLVTAGGRVMSVTGFGADAAKARERAYDAAGRVAFDGKQMRRDVAARVGDRVDA